jgi:hypothetical protein
MRQVAQADLETSVAVQRQVAYPAGVVAVLVVEDRAPLVMNTL